MSKRPPESDATLSVHAGEDRHGRNAPLTTEIQQTAVFALQNTEQLRRYAAGDPGVFLYTRYGNPTMRAAEEKIAALEQGEDCILTASGLAAELAAALTLCKSGDEIVSMLDIYGGTRKLFSSLLGRCGITTRFIRRTAQHRRLLHPQDANALPGDPHQSNPALC
jgi:O-acetylhomoserine/O-acetylserine sulfhydrylase-like pyridoxal-dependent enzyme